MHIPLTIRAQIGTRFDRAVEAFGGRFEDQAEKCVISKVGGIDSVTHSSSQPAVAIAVKGVHILM
ncbi:hypothetical protein WK41_25465 [Burkholderia cepacia]|nr:hypothetical protein WK41_25465 [Burkholderia cepacia]